MSFREYIVPITQFRGINETLQPQVGDAKVLRNFRMLPNGKMVKRQGSANVANLSFAYSISTSATEETVVEETVTTAQTFAVKPDVDVTDGGLLNLTGTGATMNYANHATYTDYYYQDTDGNVWKFKDCVYTAGTGDAAYRWNKWNAIEQSYYYYLTTGWSTLGSATISGLQSISGYASYSFNSNTGVFTNSGSYISVSAGGSGTVYSASGSSLVRTTITSTAAFDSSYVVESISATGPYYGTQYAKGTISYGYVYGATSAYPTAGAQIDSGTYYYYDTKVQNITYEWDFYPVTVVADAGTAPVRGIWSGKIGSTNYLVAACDGRMWALTIADSVWSKVNLGAFSTANAANFFGFRSKLYAQNGVKYVSWGATTHKEYTYTASGTVTAGQYFVVNDGVNYKFTTTGSLTTGDTVVFSEYDNSVKVKGVTVSTTTGVTTGYTQLTPLVESTVYDPPIDVTGYRPLTARGCSPTTGTGTAVQGINRLTGAQRIWYTNTSGNKTFQLPETNVTSVDYVLNTGTGAYYTLTTDYTVSTTNGTVTIAAGTTAPGTTQDLVEIGWTSAASDRTSIETMRYSETFSGETDAHVFVYGDGSNTMYYSGFEYESELPSAEYFPAFYFENVDSANEAITALVRHYSKMIVFKENSTFYSEYGITVLDDGTTTSAFKTVPVRRNVGNEALGQVRIVNNNPFTLFGRSIYEWAVSASNDERAAAQISAKVANTLATFDFLQTITFDDEWNTEYYACYDGTCVVLNYTTGAWYIYTDIDATCFTSLDGEVYYGTSDGYIRHFSHDYLSDVGEAIDARWESTPLDWGSVSVYLPRRKKTSDELSLTLLNEANAEISVSNIINGVASSALTVTPIRTDGTLYTKKVKLKGKKIHDYTLVLTSNNSDKTATISRVDIPAYVVD